jgi:RimJ/RimL family protein N-acetyltransferase
VITIGEHVCLWVAEQIGHKYFSGSGQGIGIEKNGEIICGIIFDNHHQNSIQMHIALKEKEKMTREFFYVWFGYAFNQLKVKKIIGVIDSTNIKVLKFGTHIGFIEEATIKDAGKHCDLIILTMTRQQCRFLKD